MTFYKGCPGEALPRGMFKQGLKRSERAAHDTFREASIPGGANRGAQYPRWDCAWWMLESVRKPGLLEWAGGGDSERDGQRDSGRGGGVGCGKS